MDLGMSSALVACLAAEFCAGVDFSTAKRTMPHMTTRAAKRKRLIFASGIHKGYASHGREVERAGSEVGWFGRGRFCYPEARSLSRRKRDISKSDASNLASLQIDWPWKSFVTIQRTARYARNFLFINDGLTILNNGDCASHERNVVGLPFSRPARL